MFRKPTASVLRERLQEAVASENVSFGVEEIESIIATEFKAGRVVSSEEDPYELLTDEEPVGPSATGENEGEGAASATLEAKEDPGSDEGTEIAPEDVPNPTSDVDDIDEGPDTEASEEEKMLAEDQQGEAPKVESDWSHTIIGVDGIAYELDNFPNEISKMRILTVGSYFSDDHIVYFDEMSKSVIRVPLESMTGSKLFEGIAIADDNSRVVRMLRENYPGYLPVGTPLEVVAQSYKESTHQPSLHMAKLRVEEVCKMAGVDLPKYGEYVNAARSKSGSARSKITATVSSSRSEIGDSSAAADAAVIAAIDKKIDEVLQLMNKHETRISAIEDTLARLSGAAPLPSRDLFQTATPAIPQPAASSSSAPMSDINRLLTKVSTIPSLSSAVSSAPGRAPTMVRPSKDMKKYRL